MKILKLIFIILLFALISCAGQPSDNEDVTAGDTVIIPVDDTPGDDATDDTDTVIVGISGKPQKGSCFYGGNVEAQPLINGSLEQAGSHFTGTMDENGYNIPAEIDEECSEIFYSGTCDNELYGGTGVYSFSGIICDSDPVKNINPLTDVRSDVARWVCSSGFGTAKECLIEAERLILNYLALPQMEQSFTGLSIEKDGIHDAASLMFSLASLHENSDAEQKDFMSRVAAGVKDNNQTFKNEIIEIYRQMPVFTVIENLKASHGQFAKIPPIWRLGFHPAYFSGIIENDHTLQGSHNLESTGGCSVDLAYKMYAIPRVLDPWIVTTKYLSTNANGDLFSIWTRDFNEYDRPGTKLLDVQRLEGISLPGPVALPYSGDLGDHNLTGGMEVYYVVSRAEAWTLTKGCSASLLPFGRLLGSNDGGQTWDGGLPINNSPFWRRGSSDYGMN